MQAASLKDNFTLVLYLTEVHYTVLLFLSLQMVLPSLSPTYQDCSVILRPFKMQLRIFVFFFLLQHVLGLFDRSTCDKTKKCVFAPVGCLDRGDCTQMFSYSANDEGWVDMEMTSSNDFPSYNYVAVGFSDDDQMGDDPVTHCVFTDSGNASAYSSYNVGKNNVPLTADEDLRAQEESLKLIHAYKGEDGMYCHFRQMTAKDSKFAPKLDKEHHLLLVRGLTNDPKDLSIHELDPNSPAFPYITANKINVGLVQKRDMESALGSDSPLMQENGTTESTHADTETTTQALWPDPKTKFWLVRVHGMLMVFAWFVFVTAAILSARYLRDNFSSSAPCGLKWWFHLHRTLNLLALPLILLSTLIIFIAKRWSWRGPSIYQSMSANFTPGSIHSLLGTISILIVILQPLLALMRCQPDTGARPIFNWTHRSLGLTGILFAVVASLIAVNSFVSLWSDPSWSIFVMIFYIIATILAVFLFEILSYVKRKAPNKSTSMEMRNRSMHRYDDSGKVINNPPKVINTKPLYATAALYGFFVLFSLCVATLLIIMLST